MVEVLAYDLPDSGLIDPLAEGPDWFFWVPDQVYLVLGQSNRALRSLITELVIADKVPVLKRPSGGESVILSPKTLVIAVRLISEKLENPRVYFKQVNGAIIQGLQNMGIKEVGYRGISDITIGNKKILGSSIYRKKSMVFYHAVLNISEDISLIGKYLQHPPKEPDYRKGRDHSDFVTSIHEAGYSIDVDELVAELGARIGGSVNR
ncbi:MAG: hypothetical protein KAH17_08295 [Bacteroidales bacterium]|nr:hypothetical protein [Bacteroidales bacterium]